MEDKYIENMTFEDMTFQDMTFEESREYIANQLQMQRNNLKIQQLQIEALEGQIETQKVAKEMAKKTAYDTQEDFDRMDKEQADLDAMNKKCCQGILDLYKDLAKLTGEEPPKTLEDCMWKPEDGDFYEKLKELDND